MQYVNDIRTPLLDPDPVNLNSGPQLSLQSLIRVIFNLGILSIQGVLTHFIKYLNVCLISLDPPYMISYFLYWVKTSWTYSKLNIVKACITKGLIRVDPAKRDRGVINQSLKLCVS